jgi:hypothetical protein
MHRLCKWNLIREPRTQHFMNGFACLPLVLATTAAGVLLVAAWLPRQHSLLARVAHALYSRPRWTLVVVAAWAMVVAGTTALYRPQLLMYSDEFCYLLMADTFAHGRLTNPTPASWEHFETHHTLLHPTYQAKYPPVQGLLLAVGQVLTGQPIVGAWLSMGLAAAAAAWLLQGIAPPRWALIAGLLVAIHPSFQHRGPFSWSQTYWGGCGAFIGGCLLYGGWFRWHRQRRWTAGLWMALGWYLLANTRPYEGLLVSVPIGVLLVRWWWARPTWREQLRLLVPLAVGLILAAGLTLGYWAAVTGNPLVMPYLVYERQYAPAPLFWWGTLQEPTEPERFFGLRHYVRYSTGGVYFAQRQSFAVWAGVAVEKWQDLWSYFGNPLLPLLFAAIPVLSRSGRMRAFLAGIGLVSVGLLAAVWFYAHYAAPMGGLMVVLAVFGLRAVTVLRPRRGVLSRFALGSTLALLTALTVQQVVAEFALRPDEWYRRRLLVLEQLRAQPGQHLVILTHGPHPDYWYDYVFNSADFATAPVLFARSLGPERDAELCAAYRARRAWRVQADDADARLVPIEPAP